MYLIKHSCSFWTRQTLFDIIRENFDKLQYSTRITQSSEFLLILINQLQCISLKNTIAITSGVSTLIFAVSSGPQNVTAQKQFKFSIKFQKMNSQVIGFRKFTLSKPHPCTNRQRQLWEIKLCQTSSTSSLVIPWFVDPDGFSSEVRERGKCLMQQPTWIEIVDFNCELFSRRHTRLFTRENRTCRALCRVYNRVICRSKHNYRVLLERGEW